MQKLQSIRKRTLNAQEEEYFFEGFLTHVMEGVHRDIICDVCELRSPLLIATACLDKIIRLISLKDQKVIGVFKGHSTGVRQLDCSQMNEGYILSVASENFVNVWSLEGGIGAIQSNLNQANKKNKPSLAGILQRGMEIIKFVRSMLDSPFCATVDCKFQIKIWDFTKVELMQAINSNLSGFDNLEVNDLIFIGYSKRFAVVSKRLHFYDPYFLNTMLQKK
jgi:WD40 repeat protein